MIGASRPTGGAASSSAFAGARVGERAPGWTEALSGAGHVAGLVSAVSLAFAAAMAVAMAVLLLRRRRWETAVGVREADMLAASRAFMRALAGDAPDLAPAPHLAQAGVSPAAKRAALSHLLRLVRGDDRVRLLAAGEQEGLFAYAIAALGRAAPARRIDAMRLLEQFGSAECVSALDRCVRTDVDAVVRLEAAAALARLGTLPPVTQLIDALRLGEHPITRLHAALLRSLAVRDAAAIAELAASASHPRLRPLLVEAIGWSEDLTAIDLLAQHAADPDPEVRCAAVRAARSLAHPAAGTWLVPLLNDPSEAVRIQAAQACGQLRVTDGVTALCGSWRPSRPGGCACARAKPWRCCTRAGHLR